MYHMAETATAFLIKVIRKRVSGLREGRGAGRPGGSGTEQLRLQGRDKPAKKKKKHQNTFAVMLKGE